MTKEQAIKTAAKWWTDKLRKGEPHDNGDNGAASVFACIFADMLADDPTDEKLAIFQIELEKEIEAEMGREDYYSRRFFLCSDYGPDRNLSAAAKKAGINEHCFPYKVTMFIEERPCGEEYVVSVKDGYGQPLDDVPFTEEEDHAVV